MAPVARVPLQGNRLISEVFAGDLAAEQVWCWLASPRLWPFYHGGISDAAVTDGAGSVLTPGARFGFTAGGQLLHGEITGCEPPHRLAWRVRPAGPPGQPGSADTLHIWLIEALRRGGVRIRVELRQPRRSLTEASSARAMHQQWLDGLVAAARSGDPAEHRVNFSSGSRIVPE